MSSTYPAIQCPSSRLTVCLTWPLERFKKFIVSLHSKAFIHCRFAISFHQQRYCFSFQLSIVVLIHIFETPNTDSGWIYVVVTPFRASLFAASLPQNLSDLTPTKLSRCGQVCRQTLMAFSQLAINTRCFKTN